MSRYDAIVIGARSAGQAKRQAARPEKERAP